MTRLPAVVSVHDVTPETLEPVGRILEFLGARGLPPVDLLVVAGLPWSDGELSTLRRWARAGHLLAGHGWSHEAPSPRGLHHRLHAKLLSRDQAEHLSRPRDELRERVRRCHAWFAGVGLPEPRFYVPPAWALGALRRADLRALPFLAYETLTGILDARTGRIRRLPLVGYEADNPARRRGLRVSNALNRAAARLTGRPLRIAIHPRDLELLLAGDLRRDVARPFRHLSARDLVGPDPGAKDAPRPRAPRGSGVGARRE